MPGVPAPTVCHHAESIPDHEQGCMSHLLLQGKCHHSTGLSFRPVPKTLVPGREKQRAPLTTLCFPRAGRSSDKSWLSLQGSGPREAAQLPRAEEAQCWTPATPLKSLDQGTVWGAILPPYLAIQACGAAQWGPGCQVGTELPWRMQDVCCQCLTAAPG